MPLRTFALWAAAGAPIRGRAGADPLTRSRGFEREMKLTTEESRALGFIALLIALSIGARLLDRPEPIALDAPGVDVAALEAASRDAIAQKDAPVERLAAGERIDANTASLDELLRLPRMRRAVAERIIAHRERTGRYGSIADLDRVPGVGPASIEAWAEHLTLPPASARPFPAAASNARGPDKPARPIDVTRASLAELEQLPGIGPALAQRIIALRDSIGGFRSVDQLVEVRGIGPVLLSKLKPRVRTGW
ncbi:MAG: ComEA family DNA-binding protein [Longimicrobiales bacterium]